MSWASSVSVDVWASIFSIVAEEVFEALHTTFLRGEVCADEFDDHRQYQALRSVCKVFHTVFLSYPELAADLYLEEDKSPTAVLSLLEHLRREDLTIRSLLAEGRGTSSLDVTLSGAVAAANRPLQTLTSALIQDCSTLSATLLSTCTALKSCTFRHGSITLDISALCMLPKLSTLRLQRGAGNGGFSGIRQLSHLTKLEVDNTAIEGEQDQWMCSSSLQALCIERGSLKNMHEDGLSQCTALQSFYLEDCLVECQASENTLDIRHWNNRTPPSLPDNLSALTQLTELQLTVLSSLHGVLECPWLPKLTALQFLHLEFHCGTTHFNVTDEMLSLAKLQHLVIVQNTFAHSPQNILSLEASLHLLPMLQTVRLHSKFLKLDRRVWKLVKLSPLKRLDFCGCQLLDHESVSYFGALMHAMGSKRPEVECYVPCPI